MSKYVSIFFLTIIITIIFFFGLGALFTGGGNPAEEAVFIFGTLAIMLLSFLIAQLYYLIDLIKKK